MSNSQVFFHCCKFTFKPCRIYLLGLLFIFIGRGVWQVRSFQASVCLTFLPAAHLNKQKGFRTCTHYVNHNLFIPHIRDPSDPMFHYITDLFTFGCPVVGGSTGGETQAHSAIAQYQPVMCCGQVVKPLLYGLPGGSGAVMMSSVRVRVGWNNISVVIASITERGPQSVGVWCSSITQKTNYSMY